MTDTKTPVGRPAKKDLSYVKLVFFDEGSDVDEWIASAVECMSLLNYKGEEAAAYILYHIRGAAKLELSMLGEGLLDNEVIFKSLRNRCSQGKARGILLRDLVDRRQREGETITSFADELLKLGLALKGEVDGWEALLIDVFKSNVKDMDLRRYLLLSENNMKFQEIRQRARKFEDITYANGACFRVGVEGRETVDARDEVTQLRARVRELENCSRRQLDDRDMGSSGVNGGYRRSRQVTGIRCYQCGNIGHISRWCRETETHLNGNPSQ